MFNVGSGEFLVILLLALVVLGPTRLPDALRQVGKFIGEAKKLSTNFQNEVNDAMKDPVKKVTGQEIPKMPRSGKELLGFAVPEPFAAMEKTESDDGDAEKPNTDVSDSSVSDSAVSDTNSDDTASGDTTSQEVADEPDMANGHDSSTDAAKVTPSAAPASPSRVEPANLPPSVGAITPAPTDAEPYDGEDGEEVPMFGDR